MSPRSPVRSGGVARLAARAVLTVAAGVAWFFLLAPNSLGGPVGMVWVSGTSMEPTMHTGDLAVMYRQSSYDVGDVVAFEIPGGATVIHRIIDVTDAGYQFQGDNRDFADPWFLGPDSIIGRQVALVPKAGTLVTKLGQPPVMALTVAVMALVWWNGRSGNEDEATSEAGFLDGAVDAAVDEYSLSSVSVWSGERARRRALGRQVCELRLRRYRSLRGGG